MSSRRQVAKQPNPQKGAEEDRSSDTRWLAVVLLLATAGLMVLAWQESETGHLGGDAAQKQYDQTAFAERVKYHRFNTGVQLNLQRIDTEIKNYQTAPALDSASQKVKSPDMMAGVPLAGEDHHRKSSRDRLQPLNPDYPDARVMYGLQEEQDATEWERRAMKRYVDEFVANAAEQGYKVKVDSNYNVQVISAPPGAKPLAIPEQFEAEMPR